MTGLIGFTTTNYKEDRRPSEDAADVGRWVILPSILAAFLGAFMFAGLAGVMPFLIVVFSLQDYGQAMTMIGISFIFSSLFFGGGFVGLLMMFGRAATYDKKPYVTIRETTQEPVQKEQPKPQQEPIRGNAAPNFTQPNGDVGVEWNGKKYTFTRRQIKAMLDRLDNENYQVARNAFEITPEDYHIVADIMAGLGYWKAWKRGGKINRIELLDDGAAWLRRVAR